MTTLAEDLRFKDGLAQADLIRSGQVSRAEVLEAAIERIERLNPPLNAVVTKMYDEARAATEDAPNRPGAEGPLGGVPFLLKDLVCPYAGVVMTNGCAAMRDYVPSRNSELVDRYLRSGLVVAGKTNTCEMGLMNTTEPLLFGPARNPWDRDRTTAGSSGGSGAAVARRHGPHRARQRWRWLDQVPCLGLRRVRPQAYARQDYVGARRWGTARWHSEQPRTHPVGARQRRRIGRHRWARRGRPVSAGGF